MNNPYHNRPDHSFWKKAVFEQQDALSPVVAKAFKVAPDDRLVTAGSCFAQNLGRHLREYEGVTFHQAEPLLPDDPFFSARTGNVYTALQLLQLFEECQSGEVDPACAVQRRDRLYVDVHRPYMQPEGFATAQDVIDARATHLEAVREMLTTAGVFVFTLGLTEAWHDTTTGRALPVCPGLYTDDSALKYHFHNYSYAEVDAAMDRFTAGLAAVNPTAKILLTVSPVPLTATYTDDHVLVATMHSKSVLRVVCSSQTERHANTYYFPSYEMISNPYTVGSPYAPDNLRSIEAGAISEVMAFFEQAYLDKPASGTATQDAEVMCDEVEIERSMGF